jgi:hypothetical protein
MFNFTMRTGAEAHITAAWEANTPSQNFSSDDKRDYMFNFTMRTGAEAHITAAWEANTPSHARRLT